MTFSMTFSSISKTLGLVATFQSFQNFLCFGVFFDLKQFKRHKLWHPPLFSILQFPCFVMTALTNYQDILHRQRTTKNINCKTYTFIDKQKTKKKYEKWLTKSFPISSAFHGHSIGSNYKQWHVRYTQRQKTRLFLLQFFNKD